MTKRFLPLLVLLALALPTLPAHADGLVGPATVDCGSSMSGMTVECPDLIFRTEGRPVTILDIGEYYSFESTCRPSFQFSPGESCVLKLRPRPTGVGPQSWMVAVRTDVNSFFITASYFAHGFIVAPAYADFGQVEVGSKATRTLTLRATRALTLGNPAVTGQTADFSVVGGTCRAGAIYTQHETCTLDVAYHPNEEGPSTTTLTIRATDDTSEGWGTIALPVTGKGRIREP